MERTNVRKNGWEEEERKEKGGTVVRQKIK